MKIQATSEIWKIDYANQTGLNVKGVVDSYKMGKDIYAFKVKEVLTEPSIIITDLIRFLYITSFTAQEGFILVEKYTDEWPKQLYHPFEEKMYSLKK